MIGRRSWDSRPLARLTEGGALEINSRVPHFESGATADALRRKIVATGAHSQLVAITIPAGTESGEDIHNSSDQAVFVVAGAGQAILNGHTESAGEHDALFIPAGTVANFINPGASDFKLLVAYSPPVTPEAGSTERSEGVNFYAIAQSSTVADEKDAEVGQAFPGGIKWTSWKSPTLRNVLFAADFSPASNTALPYAVSMARHYRSNLYVAHIIIPDVSGLIAPHLIDRVRTDLKAAATEKIEQLIRSAGAGDIKYEPLVAEGAIGDALLSAIRKKDVDLVVLGTHGRRRLRKLVLGSVAEEIFRLAPCPVLTIGPNAARSEPLQFKNLVYPIELRGDVLKAAEYAISIAKEYNAALHTS